MRIKLNEAINEFSDSMDFYLSSYSGQGSALGTGDRGEAKWSPCPYGQGRPGKGGHLRRDLNE